MKILVLSDSHSGLGFMRFALDRIKPDAVVHLGDYFDDGTAIAEDYPHIPFHQVPGNCDRYRCPVPQPEVLCYDICGVRLFMTHGHLHHVKSTCLALCRNAREMGAAAALFGHTHEALCRQEEDGLWVLNPGSCGSYGGSVGLITVINQKIQQCRILRQAELEEYHDSDS